VNPERVQRSAHGPENTQSETAAWRAVVRVLRSSAAGAVHSLTSVIFPADCRVCGLPLPGFSLLPVCELCWNNLPVQAGALCTRCGESLPGMPPIRDSVADEAVCRVCRAAAPPFEKAVAHGVYAGKLRALIHLMKYDGMEPVAKRLGLLVAEQALAIPALPDDLAVVPVPLFAGKKRQRGFNQSEALARFAVRAMLGRRPAMRLQLEAGILERRRATESQAGLSPHQRRVNVRGAFFVPRPAAVDGRNVLVIDDIYTTGATARSCARALKSAGAARVWVATVARAQREFGLQHSDTAAEPLAHEDREIPMDQDVALWDEGR
jgi:ComF family protein